MNKNIKVLNNGVTKGNMDNLSIFGTEDSPRVYFDAENGAMEITGRSLPENVNVFYHPIIEWALQYIKNPQPKTKIEFKLEYLNSASSKKILELLVILKQLQSMGHDLEINWFHKYEDEDMHEEGKDFETMTKLDFNFYEM